MPEELVASGRIRRIQRTALVLLVVSGAINYVDRATLAVGLPLIRKDLNLSLVESGFLLSAFLWTYAFAQLPAGAIIDRLGARLMISVSLSLWSIAQGLGGLVRNFWQFILVRVLLGAGEAPQFPSCARVVADWFNKRERGFATGIWNCSSSLGTAIAAPLLTFLMLRLGWRGMFGTMGLAGLVVALIVYRLHRDPRQVPLEAEERAYLTEGHVETGKVTWRIWRSLFCFRTVWGMILGYFGAMYMLWIYTAWLPQYLEIELHMSIAKTGWIASIPFFFGVVGSLITGRVCDLLLRHGFSPIASRKIPMMVSLLGAALCTLLAAHTRSNVLAICYISATLFLLYSTACAAWAMSTVVAPTNCTASISSIQNFFGYLGGALAPIATGSIVQMTGSFRPALLVGALIVIAGAIGYFILVGEPVLLEPGPAEAGPR